MNTRETSIKHIDHFIQICKISLIWAGMQNLPVCASGGWEKFSILEGILLGEQHFVWGNFHKSWQILHLCIWVWRKINSRKI